MSGTSSTSSTPAPKARKKRFFFRTRDDLLFVRTLLDDRDAVLSLNRGERTAGWEAVATKLNRQGIIASSHTLRCRQKRLVDNFEDEVAQGKQTSDLTELERLLDQPRAHSNPTHNFSDSDSDRAAATEQRPRRLSLPPLAELVSTSTSFVLVQSTPGSGRKSRKRRFFFQDRHDVLLLTAVLADRGVEMASGARKPSWKDITTSFNSHGFDANAHTLRTHLRLLVDTHRKEASSLKTDPARLSAKQKLLRKYCRKLDGQEEQDSSDTDDPSTEPGTGSQDSETNDDQVFEPEHDQNGDGRAATNRPEVAGRVLASAGWSRSHATDLVQAAAVANLPPERELITASTQMSEPASSSTNVDEASTTETSTFSDTREISVQTEEASLTPTAAQDRSATKPAADHNDSEEVTEPAWKRQKLELETILQRFVSEQSERHREEREQEHARTKEQQDIQRQTIELQKRALDMQEKAMNMQDRLMSLMEKVMDKLN
ncbi:hypothetical protein PHYSODRAFT_306288 [Phytophthora sojae]|uniref:Uncharacterized protein n=1 Tax=Phytophthora sojae (strain P6497) TaxID=1094619 RepID=G5A8W6_PHYSP|nr:hypothetical protein PHYSODRAFT_306288 [Phytophthora sojae]EGZ08342.1 hypothetical protein PHYSODRAFT_306288 [Phytophthora sojae]|eukprot:XP_009536514.1 hypothetical protein PHYSODRAFT_306288 [Phytophthora sojae]